MGDSEWRQLESARSWASRERLTLDESIRVEEGRSGYHGAHRAKGHLGEFLRRVEASLIPRGSLLVVENVHRLSREGPLSVLRDIIGKLWDRGITPQTLSPEEAYPPGCDGDPRFIALFRTSLEVEGTGSATWKPRKSNGPDASVASKWPTQMALLNANVVMSNSPQALMTLLRPRAPRAGPGGGDRGGGRAASGDLGLGASV